MMYPSRERRSLLFPDVDEAFFFERANIKPILYMTHYLVFKIAPPRGVFVLQCHNDSIEHDFDLEMMS
jgi:hypothetical protein